MTLVDGGLPGGGERTVGAISKHIGSPALVPSTRLGVPCPSAPRYSFLRSCSWMALVAVVLF